MGDSMFKDRLCGIHMLALSLLIGSFAYIYLNETGKLEKVKNKCMDKVMDVKEDLKEKLD